MSDDLISREAAMLAIHNAQTAAGWSNGMHEMDIHKALMKVPAVDAAPVVHGRWILKTCWDADGALIVTAECSEGCELIREIWHGYFIDVPEHIAERTALSKAKMAHLSNYCPDCGAKMDLEGGTR